MNLTFSPRLIAAAMLAWALCACGQAEAPEAAQPPEFLDLLCSSFAGVSESALVRAYGRGNVRNETLPGPEGESYQASVLFPDDPVRRLEIVWRDPAVRSQPASVSVSGQSNWIGNNGLTIGDTIARVQELNGGPFRLWGFGWDYGGWVSEWSGGVFAPANGCMTRVRFEARGEGAAGDSEFASDDAGVRAADPIVTEFGLSFATR